MQNPQPRLITKALVNPYQLHLECIYHLRNIPQVAFCCVLLFHPSSMWLSMNSIKLESDTVRTAVREHYGKVATRQSASGCGCAPTCCSADSGQSTTNHV